MLLPLKFFIKLNFLMCITVNFIYLFIFQLIALNCHFYKQHIKTFVLFKF